MKRLAYSDDGSFVGIDAHVSNGAAVADGVDPDAYTKEELVEMADEAGVASYGTKAEIAARLSGE